MTPANGATCAVPDPQRVGRRGILWLFGSFAFCPCHLPITLWFLGTVLSGSAVGLMVRNHPYIAGTLTTAIWIAGTWRGFHLLNASGKSDPT